MTETERLMIQRMIRSVRERNNRYGGWPGKPLNAPASTLYPNILAEIEASWMHLWCPAEAANVSPKTMAAVLEDGEDLTVGELLCLCKLYRRDPDYMADATLQLINSTDNEGREKRCELEDMLKQAEGLDCLFLPLVEDVLFVMDNGKPVTVAAYRRAEDELQDVLREAQRIPRTKRICFQSSPKADTL